MNAAHLWPYQARCQELLHGVTWRARWVPRDLNAAADAQSRAAYAAASARAGAAEEGQ